MNGKMIKMNTFEDVLFALMCICVYVFNFATGRILFLSGYMLTNLLFAAFIGWSLIKSFRYHLMVWNKIYTLAILFVFFGLLSSIGAYSVSDTLAKVRTMFLVVLLSLCIYKYIVDENRLDYVLNIYVWAGTICAIYLLLNTNIGYDVRIGRVIGDINLVGISLAIANTIALYLLFTDGKKYHLLQIAVLGIVILLTGSRTAFAIFAVSIILVIYATAYIKKWKLRYIVLATTLIIVAGAALWHLIMTVPALYNSLGIRVVSFLQIQRGQRSVINEQSTQTRHLLANQALEWFEEKPILGNGIGSFPMYNARVLDGKYEFSHCNYTEILSGEGIIGFLLYYGMFVYALYVGAFSKVKNKYNIILIALVIEYIVGDIGLVVYYEKVTWITIAIMAGLITKIKHDNYPEYTVQ